MKFTSLHRKTQAMTLTEVLVVISVLAIIVFIYLPYFNRPHSDAGIFCMNNVKQIDVSSLVWANDHDNLFPFQVPAVNGGSMELAATGNVAAVFQIMSNEWFTPKLLICPDDTNHIRINSFSDDFS